MLRFVDVYHTRMTLRISDQLESGNLVGLTGSNGAGKTTLLKIASGLLTGYEGHVELNGRSFPTWNLRERSSLVTYLEATPHAFWNVSVRVLLDILGPQSKSCMETWIHHMEIGGFLGRLIHHLSAGERQRVFLAAALARSAPILLLDEPLRHLDVRFQRLTLGFLKGLAREKGRAILAVLHQPQLTTTYCDKIWHMGETADLGFIAVDRA